jgi:hypothetical protein
MPRTRAHHVSLLSVWYYPSYIVMRSFWAQFLLAQIITARMLFSGFLSSKCVEHTASPRTAFAPISGYYDSQSLCGLSICLRNASLPKFFCPGAFLRKASLPTPFFLKEGVTMFAGRGTAQRRTTMTLWFPMTLVVGSTLLSR